MSVLLPWCSCKYHQVQPCSSSSMLHLQNPEMRNWRHQGHFQACWGQISKQAVQGYPHIGQMRSGNGYVGTRVTGVILGAPQKWYRYTQCIAKGFNPRETQFMFTASLKKSAKYKKRLTRKRDGFLVITWIKGLLFCEKYRNYFV